VNCQRALHTKILIRVHSRLPSPPIRVPSRPFTIVFTTYSRSFASIHDCLQHLLASLRVHSRPFAVDLTSIRVHSRLPSSSIRVRSPFAFIIYSRPFAVVFTTYSRSFASIRGCLQHLFASVRGCLHHLFAFIRVHSRLSSASIRVRSRLIPLVFPWHGAEARRRSDW
jgi:hypothetical protein